MHSTVRDILTAAYKTLETTAPGKVFKYAETGFEEGEPFKPHKTHQNGLSVDFMVPVVNKKSQSVHFPTNAFNKFGYAIEFDAMSRYKNYQIDFDAIGTHIGHF